MSDLNTGTYASVPSTSGGASKTKQVAEQGKQAVADVKETAAQQAQRVGAEAKTQARNVAGEVRDKLGEQARTQSDRLVGSIRQTADHLDEMRGDRGDTPAAMVVSRVADGGRQLADYLDRNGPDGVLAEVQDFARRRPGAFLATALAAGFVVGRLGKSVAKADPTAGTTTPSGNGYTPATTPDPVYTPATGARPGYPATANTSFTGTEAAEPNGGYPGTEYAATGTGIPVVAEPERTVPGQGLRP
ncbi:hypothetical protein [Actinoplanes xinjiangensis]|uniref:Uncharacterized protein n=1 Tax=Actinoplanes xinjiangensis TaxID=512350 RepID=A0A316EJ24_9ACTN|nr:hypothetical protein [Actinoplanes xinjiangensis]PWK31668.1 hypothetical protein BC793_13217 [Actinoplanes xinjiangensis]GIF43959.1 hypothetical protein Axi01nite_82700 [Actinoplanes xinjiangensis]